MDAHGDALGAPNAGAFVSSPSIDEQLNQALAPASEALYNRVLFKVPIFGAEVPLVVSGESSMKKMPPVKSATSKR